MLDDPAAVPGSSKDADGAQEGDSYEELVMKRVAAYVQQSQVHTNGLVYEKWAAFCYPFSTSWRPPGENC